ncbi:MAG: hypothetical protein LQ339_000402 [Xanthoria mediterranea]|nr:MAG: hypothetical protein LQ339_000402 [Xanthoria mediterranea]
MDVHRCRFVPYPPSGINALAFSHPSSLATSSKGLPTLRLAIGRANGDIEIWNPLRGAWHHESTFRGGKDRSIEGLVWTHDPEEQDKNGLNVPGRLRLYSIGYSSAVTEWDLGSGLPIRHASGNYGELWCIAAQPRLPSTKIKTPSISNGNKEDDIEYQSLAVGCADGSIVLFSTAEGDLKFERTLTRPAKKKARVLSITWQTRHIVITGHADSTIRIFDVRNGQQIRSMSLGAGPEGGPKEILVWSVKCMVDGTIVSGDSTGTVSFWDAKLYSRLQRITSHKADVLDLAVSVDGEAVFSGSMDRRTTLYRRTVGSRPGEKRRWVEIAHQRFHSHDVKAMATFETKGISILASGGLDTTPIIVPIREYGKEHHRTLSCLPQKPPVCSAPKKRLLVSWWDREVSLWRIATSLQTLVESNEYEDPSLSPAKRLMAKVLIQGEESITSADIVQDGSLLVVATLSTIKVFRLKAKNDSTIGLRKIELPSELHGIGAKIIQWSPDGKWLLSIASNNKVQAIRVAGWADSKKGPHFLPQIVNLKRLPRKALQFNYLNGSLGAYNRSISCVAFSVDSRVLVVGDLSGHLDTWVLEGHEDLTQDPPITRSSNDKSSSSSSSSSDESDESDAEHHPTLVYAQHWKRNPTAHLIPKLPSAALIMSFRPTKPTSISPEGLTNGNGHLHPTRYNPYPHSHDLPTGEDRLFIVTAEHQFYEINILAGKISDWSRRNPTSALPKEFRSIRDRAMGCIWDVAPSSSPSPDRHRIWLYGNTWLWMFDLAQDLPRPDHDENEESDRDEPQVGEFSQTRKRRREKAARKKSINLSMDHDGDSLARFAKKERDTGAGSRIPAHELVTGVGRKMRKTIGAKGADASFVKLGRDVSDESEAEDDEEEEEDEDDQALMKLRRGGDVAMVDGDGNGTDKTDEKTQKEMRTGPPFWGTFKYRPILGIVPIGGREDDENDDPLEGTDRERRGRRRAVEVALVERPMFDVDLPERFYGDQEWSEKKDADVRL